MSGMEVFTVISGLASIVSLALAVAAMMKAKEVEVRLASMTASSTNSGTQQALGSGNIQAGGNVQNTNGGQNAP